MMSLRSLLMPHVTARIFSRERLLAKRTSFEKKRISQGKPHQLHYFHQVDDPYSALMLQVLPLLQARYDVKIVPHLVSPPEDSAAPERDKLIAYSRQDAQALAEFRGLSFADPTQQPNLERQEQVSRQMLGLIQAGRFIEHANSLSQWLWSKDQTASLPVTCTDVPCPNLAELEQHLEDSNLLRRKLGHYLGGMLYYQGEWYWAVDRLHHLEQRLQDLKLHKPGVKGVLYPHEADLTSPLQLKNPPDIDFFFSFRSPYSAIVAPRVFSLGRMTGAKVNLRFVLPMVMRGLAVPPAKRQYIAHDTAREAFVRGTPFGRLNDPVGRPAERGLALVPYAEESGKGEAFVLSFMQGVWAEGIDAGSDKGLRKIVERAGLDWAGAMKALADESWRLRAEANRTELFSLGLWGVPSFRVGSVCTWGQDRLWQVQQAVVSQSKPSEMA